MKELTKVLFLDIDGVLNSNDNKVSLNLNYRVNKDETQYRDRYGVFFDDRCVRHLNWIIHMTGCKLVISSTRRIDGINHLKNLWDDRNLPGEIIDVTPLIVNENVVDLYSITNERADRGFEIQQWLEDNDCDRYCIVDDDTDMLKHQMENFVKTDSNYGITINDATAIIEILNSKSDNN